MFNEENTVEDLVKNIISEELGWKFIPREALQRKEKGVFVESFLRDALVKFNPSLLKFLTEYKKSSTN